jgi:PTH1 family peptidyl-tRNA hydrolase
VLLAKPLTYMNRSGQAVAAIVSRRRIDISRLLVVFDDLDLPLGTLRLRPGGGHGGHKGMMSIILALGRNDFARLRLGIGRPPGRMDPADYVLRDFAPAEKPEVAVMRERAADAVEVWLEHGIDAAMNQFNR